jgi:hemerythrin-like domain-containing protein
MDLYQLIRHDHQKVKRLFERLADAAAGTPSQARLFGELKHELELHSEVEERHFYAALTRHEEAKDLLEGALEEHGAVGSALEQLDQGDKENAGWTEQLADLQQDVEQHIEEEETELFPLAQKLLDTQELDAIARNIAKDKAVAQNTSG